jgi:hypothetical protein
VFSKRVTLELMCGVPGSSSFDCVVCYFDLLMFPENLCPDSSSSSSSSSYQPGKRKRGRPRKHPLPVDVQLPVKKRAKIAKSQHGPKSKPAQDDVVLSLMDDYYKDIMYSHFRMLGVNRVKEEEDEAIEKVFTLLKRRVGRDGSFFKRVQATGTYVVVSENEARSSESSFHFCISVTCAFR